MYREKTQVLYSTQISHMTTCTQGRSQDFGEGGAEYARAKRARKFWPRPLTKWKGRSSNYHRERVLTVASELESTF